MIIYKYKSQNMIDVELHVRDDGPKIICVKSDLDTGYYFLDQLEDYICDVTNTKDFSLKNKKILDVGMGNGDVLKYISNQLGTDIYGVDLNNQIYFNNYKEGFTFPNTDVRDLVEKFKGTFDVIYQRLFSVPFRDTQSVLLAISKLLKDDGIYVVTLDDDYYSHSDSFVVKILNELYDTVQIRKNSYKRDVILGCAAMKPKNEPVLSPMESYYDVLNDAEFNNYKRADSEEQRQKILNMSRMNHQ